MQNEPKVFFEADANTFAQPAQIDNRSAFHASDGGHCCAQQKGRRDTHVFKGRTLNSLLKRLDVNNDVRQFRHNCFLGRPYCEIIQTPFITG